MIEVIFKSKGSEHKGMIPGEFSEVTCKQFMAFESLESPVQILAAVMGIDLSFLLNSSSDLTPVMNRLINTLNDRPAYFDIPTDKGFKILDKIVKFPKNIQKMMFGQVLQIKDLIDVDINKNLLKIASISIQPIFDGEFKEDRQPYFMEIIEGLPVINVFPSLFFFAETLKKYRKYGRVTFQELF